jgi:hypothetical protein
MNDGHLYDKVTDPGTNDGHLYDKVTDPGMNDGHLYGKVTDPGKMMAISKTRLLTLG